MVSTQVVTTLGDNPSRPVLQFLQFIAQNNVAFVPGLKNIHSGERIQKLRIRQRIRRISVDGRRIRKEKVTDSKISGYVWTVPKLVVAPTLAI